MMTECVDVRYRQMIIFCGAVKYSYTELYATRY